MLKNAKNSEKKWKKQKNSLEIRFALFRFEAKITQVKRSENFEAERSEKREVKFYSEIVKHIKRIQIRFISLISETGSPYTRCSLFESWRLLLDLGRPLRRPREK